VVRVLVRVLVRSLAVAGLVGILGGGCFRLGFAVPGEVGDTGPGDQGDLGDYPDGHGPTPVDGGLEGAAGDGALDVSVDKAVAPLKDLSPDTTPQQQSAKLVNSGADPLNTKASATLTWSSCASTFTGELVVKGLAAGQIYQIKLDQDWAVDYQVGKNLSSVCRTWDDTIWTKGDVNKVLPAPHAGVAAGDVHASNIGDYLSTSAQDALYKAGHKLSGYLMFAFFKVIDASTVDYTEDDQTAAKTIKAKADGVHLPIVADFSWHTSTSKQKGFVSMPKGQYTVRFLVTRESVWADPLILSKISFKVGACP
jgi:hypothetical protein